MLVEIALLGISLYILFFISKYLFICCGRKKFPTVSYFQACFNYPVNTFNNLHFNLKPVATNVSNWNLSLDGGQYIWKYTKNENLEQRPQNWLEEYYLKTPKCCDSSAKASFDSSEVLSKGIEFISHTQCKETGHWDGDYNGPHFLIPSAIISSYYIYVKQLACLDSCENTESQNFNPFSENQAALRQEIIRYIINSRCPILPNICHQSQTNDKSILESLDTYERQFGWVWGLHYSGVQDRPQPYLISTVLYYICLRLLGMSANDHYLTATRNQFHQFYTGKLNGSLQCDNRNNCEPSVKEKEDLVNSNAEAVLSIASWGKFLMSVIGLYSYDGLNALLPEIWCIPKFMFCHPSKMWCHVRQLYLPMTYCYGAGLTLQESELPDIIRQIRNELYGIDKFDTISWYHYRNVITPTDLYSPHSLIYKFFQAPLNLYQRVHNEWLRAKALIHVYDHVCADDRFTSFTSIAPMSKVFNMLVRGAVEGYDAPSVEKHLEAIKYNWWMGHDGLRLRGTNGSQFWDTIFYVLALLEALEINDPTHSILPLKAKILAATMVKRAVWGYCMDQQTLENFADYKKYYRHPPKGGFPFSTKKCGWVLSDCTAEAIYVLSRIYEILYVSSEPSILKSVLEEPLSNGDFKLGITLTEGLENLESKTNFCNPSPAKLRERIYMAVDCLLLYSNKCGGIASYEKIRGSDFLELLDPAELFGHIMVEYPYVECTSAGYKGLAKFHQIFPTYRSIEIISFLNEALDFVLNKQREDGSFEGSWGVAFTYAAFFALGILAPFSPFLEENFTKDESLKNIERLEETFNKERAIIKGCSYLLKHQNEDGGWGEDFISIPLREWIKSRDSNVVQTSWALLALMAVKYPNKEAISRGIKFISSRQLPDGDWTEELNTGCFNKSTAIIYSNYKNIYPIMALSRYHKLYGQPKLSHA